MIIVISVISLSDLQFYFTTGLQGTEHGCSLWESQRPCVDSRPCCRSPSKPCDSCMHVHLMMHYTRCMLPVPTSHTTTSHTSTQCLDLPERV